MRLSELKKALARVGIELVKPKKGSHWKFVEEGNTYPVPAHNGLKSVVRSEYVKGVARCFGLKEDELQNGRAVRLKSNSKPRKRPSSHPPAKA